MPMYIVGHPEEKLSLVYASNLMELYKVTDCGQYVSRRPCSFREINKPLCLNIKTTTPVFLDRYSSIDLIRDVDTQKECLDYAEELLNSGLYSDVTLDINGTELPCHKAILANRCQFFKVMFESDMVERNSLIIHLRGHDLRIMMCVIRFIYTGRLLVPHINSNGSDIKQGQDDSLDAEEMAKFFDGILKAADYFGLESLDSLCQRQIAEYCGKKDIYLREDFLSLMFSLASEHDCTELKYFVAGCLCTYLQEDVGAKTAYDIVRSLQVKELYTLVTHILKERGYDLKQKRDEDILSSAITNSANVSEVITTFEKVILSNTLSLHCCAVHYICKLCSQSTPSYTGSSHTWTHFWRSILEVLLDYGFNVNQQDQNGDTPLHIACRGDADKIMSNTDTNVMLIQWLLKHGTNPHIRNNKGFTAIEEAYSHINTSLPLIASYYLHEEEDGMHIVSQSSLVQDFTEKINCLVKQETLLQNAMVEEEPLTFHGLSHRELTNHFPCDTSQGLLVGGYSQPICNNITHDEDENEYDDFIAQCDNSEHVLRETLSADEVQLAVESDVSSGSDEADDVTPPSSFMFNPAFLDSCKMFTDSSLDAFPVAHFTISDMIGDNENSHIQEKMDGEMLEFMYPELHKQMLTIDDLSLIDSQQLKTLESAAMNDVLARRNVCGSGLKLQSTDTLATLDASFDEVLRTAAEACIMPYTDLISNIALVS